MHCFLPKSEYLNIMIGFLDETNKIFQINSKQKGMNLLSKVAKCVDVNNYEYFGLRFKDMFNRPQWLENGKPVRRQLKKNQADKYFSAECSEQVYRLTFEVRYYPRDPTSIDNENFRYQIFLQVRKDMSDHKLVIKDEKSLASLCALILQSDFGDFHEAGFAPNYVRQVIPHTTTNNLNLEELVRQAHMNLKGIEPVHAEYQFLEKIRWLDNYGAMIFPVKDIRNKNCYLGLNPHGFSLKYSKDVKSNYEIYWPRISSIRRKGRRIIIKERNEHTNYHHFETGDKMLCLDLYSSAQDHFAFFKSKKDEKPITKEPLKRTYGQRNSKEFGYSSDNSGDNNHYSDDTFSSYPDSINTTQSTRSPKVIKKPKLAQRNCISDVEEATLSKKHRRVIVSKSQTETEDENYHVTGPFSDSQIYTQKPSKTQTVSYDRIPPDYIYENRRTVQSSSGVDQQIQKKRLRKKSSQRNNNGGRKFHGSKEMENHIRNQKSVPSNSNDLYRIPFQNVRTRDSGYEVIRAKSNDNVQPKARIRRRLPKTDSPNQTSRTSIPTDDQGTERRVSEPNLELRPSHRPPSSSTPPSHSRRSSPTKRQLPNIVQLAGSASKLTATPTATPTSMHWQTHAPMMPPAVPEHRPRPPPPAPLSHPNRMMMHPPQLHQVPKMRPTYRQPPPLAAQQSIARIPPVIGHSTFHPVTHSNFNNTVVTAVSKHSYGSRNRDV